MKEKGKSRLEAGGTKKVAEKGRSRLEALRPRSGQAGGRKRGGKRTEVASSKFRIGKLEMECWEYATPYRDPEPLTEVLCATKPNGIDFNLRASFLGEEEDKASFYRVLKSANPEGVN